MQKLLIVTATYKRPRRSEYLSRLAKSLILQPNILWLVVEDESSTDRAVNKLLTSTGIPFQYLTAGRTRDMGNTPKNRAFDWIVQNRQRGVVYVADDDNEYSPKVWRELRQTQGVRVIPVRNLGPSGIERPLLSEGRIIGWDSGWTSRKYPLDWAGFAFHSDLLVHVETPFLGVKKPFRDKIVSKSAFLNLDRANRKQYLANYFEGESEFLEKLVGSESDFEVGSPLCFVKYNGHSKSRGSHTAAKAVKFIIAKVAFLWRALSYTLV